LIATLKQIIIFDFDGVLVDSLDNLYQINSAAAIALDRSLTKDQYLSAFAGPLNQKLGEILSLNEAELEKFINHKRQIFANHYNGTSVQPFPFALDLIKQASDLGTLWILSTAPLEHIRVVLEEHNLLNYFARIIGQSQQPKSVFLNEAVSESERTFFLTDTVGDLKEAGKVDGVISIGVTWGFHQADVLKTGNPSFVAHNPKDVISFIRD